MAFLPLYNRTPKFIELLLFLLRCHLKHHVVLVLRHPKFRQLLQFFKISPLLWFRLTFRYGQYAKLFIFANRQELLKTRIELIPLLHSLLDPFLPPGGLLAILDQLHVKAAQLCFKAPKINICKNRRSNNCGERDAAPSDVAHRFNFCR
jgi:hypothetical protein